MNMEELKNNPDVINLVSTTFGEFMQTHMKQEQADKIAGFKMLNATAKKGEILFTGSSLMEQFPVAELAINHGLDKVVYNRGIGGYTTDDFLREIDTVLFDLEPSKIFINIGTNDISEATFGSNWKNHLLGNYAKILDQIKQRLPETEVYLMAYYPVNLTVADENAKKFMLATRTNESLAMMNEAVEKLANTYPYHFINVNEGLTDANGELKAEYTKEGVHMYANAYEIVYRNLTPYL